MSKKRKFQEEEVPPIKLKRCETTFVGTCLETEFFQAQFMSYQRAKIPSFSSVHALAIYFFSSPSSKMSMFWKHTLFVFLHKTNQGAVTIEHIIVDMKQRRQRMATNFLYSFAEECLLQNASLFITNVVTQSSLALIQSMSIWKKKADPDNKTFECTF
jgi:hypothetical protein